jgi:hypothetical protein
MTPFRAETIEDVLAKCTPKVRRLAEAARNRIGAVVPEATEKLRPGWGLIGYNAPAYFAFIVPGRDDVRIGFEWGALLDDPEHLLQGEGRQVRYVTIRTVRELRAPALAILLKEAAALCPPRRSSARPARRR